MRIGIDARFYGTHGKGLGRYTQKLIEFLEKVDHENEYFIFMNQEGWPDYVPQVKNFKKVLANYRWYTVREQLLMPLKIRRYQLDIMHFTHFNVPYFTAGKFIVTIHDLILTKYPTQRATTLGPIMYKFKHLAYHLTISRAIKRAERIIAVSGYTKKDIIKHFKINHNKIDITYEGVSTVPEIKSGNQKILKKYNIKTPYLLYVGNVYPHKNIEGLLQAFKIVLKQLPDLSLVLVGKADYFFDRIKKVVAEQQLEQNVIFSGFVTDQDLPHLYKNSELYVFPSFCEGFGLPALEACSYGTPVIASNNTCLPEVLGPAARYFNPYRPGEIANAMIKVLSDKVLQSEMIQAGYQQAGLFSWEKMAKSTLNLYKKV